MSKFMEFVKDEKGVAAIEYALVAAGISMAIAVVVWLVGDQLYAVFDNVRQNVGPDRPASAG